MVAQLIQYSQSHNRRQANKGAHLARRDSRRHGIPSNPYRSNEAKPNRGNNLPAFLRSRKHPLSRMPLLLKGIQTKVVHIGTLRGIERHPPFFARPHTTCRHYGTRFDYPSSFSPEAYYKDSIGIWVNEEIKPEKVIIRAYGTQSKYLRTLPLHHSQKETYTSDEYCDFEYQLCVTQNLISELLAKGKTIQVMEPESLRLEMKKCLYYMFNFYKL